jgi:lysophospholipase L1-like esterase
LIALLILLVAAELFARFYVGLGDPPLFTADPAIEYLYQPSESYHRLGHRISFNAWSMRSDEFASRKTDPTELRIMVLGDSVINGGAFTDQDDVATEALKAKLESRFGARPVTVGNISAGSWGPANLLAYVRRFGLFDADAVIIVLGSEDYGDAPDFRPLSSDMPTRTPLFALQEALPRYGPQFLNYFRKGMTPTESEARPADVESSLQALRELIDLIRSSSDARLVVALHMEAMELINNKPKPGYDAIRRLCENRGVATIEFAPRYRQAMNAGRQVFRDYVHPSTEGHDIMADSMLDWILASEE